MEIDQYESIGGVYRWKTTIEDGSTLICQTPPVPGIFKRIPEGSSVHTDITEMPPHLSSFFRPSGPACCYEYTLPYPSLRNAALYPNPSFDLGFVLRLVSALQRGPAASVRHTRSTSRDPMPIIMSLPMSCMPYLLPEICLFRA
jgi:hypothetical protein